MAMGDVDFSVPTGKFCRCLCATTAVDPIVRAAAVPSPSNWETMPCDRLRENELAAAERHLVQPKWLCRPYLGHSIDDNARTRCHRHLCSANTPRMSFCQWCCHYFRNSRSSIDSVSIWWWVNWLFDVGSNSRALAPWRLSINSFIWWWCQEKNNFFRFAWIKTKWFHIAMHNNWTRDNKNASKGTI